MNTVQSVSVFFLVALASASSEEMKSTLGKRGLELGYGAYPGSFNGFNAFAGFSNQDVQYALPNFGAADSAFLPPSVGPLGYSKNAADRFYAPVSPAEIAAAVTAAKEASTNVASAQQRVHAAKEDVLVQQRIASAKEHQAAIAVQKSEAAAAVQREQASAAAQSLVQAQQRLAEAKNYVSQQQRIAAVKEAQAAHVIQQNAAAAAAALHKNDNVAAKIAASQRFETAAVQRHASVSKAATLGANSAGVAAASPGSVYLSQGPWAGAQGAVHVAPWGK